MHFLLLNYKRAEDSKTNKGKKYTAWHEGMQELAKKPFNQY